MFGYIEECASESWAIEGSHKATSQEREQKHYPDTPFSATTTIVTVEGEIISPDKKVTFQSKMLQKKPWCLVDEVLLVQ